MPRYLGRVYRHPSAFVNKNDHCAPLRARTKIADGLATWPFPEMGTNRLVMGIVLLAPFGSSSGLGCVCPRGSLQAGAGLQPVLNCA